MQDLYEFPYCERREEEQNIDSIESWIKSNLRLSPKFQQRLPEASHGFTRYR